MICYILEKQGEYFQQIGSEEIILTGNLHQAYKFDNARNAYIFKEKNNLKDFKIYKTQCF